MGTDTSLPVQSMRGPLPPAWERFDDPWGITWRAVKLFQRLSLRRTLRFGRAFVGGGCFERPVFIIGAPRSGTTMLLRLLGESDELAGFPHEGHNIWRAFHHPRASGWRSDHVGAGEVRPGERRWVNALLRAYLAGTRFVEKTPENSLRILYLLDLFPDAHFVVMMRNPCDVIHSLVTGWRHPQGRFRSYFVPENLNIPGYPYRRQWCFTLIEGWRRYTSASLETIAFEQWRQSVTALAAARPLVPEAHWHEFALESFVADPQYHLRALCAGIGIHCTPRLLAKLDHVVATPVNGFFPPGPHAWRQGDHEAMSALLPRIAEAAGMAGYRLDPATGDFARLSGRPALHSDPVRRLREGGEGVAMEPLRAECGKRTFRAMVTDPGRVQRYVVKEFGPRGLLDRLLLDRLRAGPGLRYPAADRAIREAGVQTAPMVFMARRLTEGASAVWIGTRELEGAKPLGAWLQNASAGDRHHLLALTGRAVAMLHQAGVFHFDLNEDNILFRRQGENLEGPYLVDLDYTVQARRRNSRLASWLARLDLRLFFGARGLALTPKDQRAFLDGYRTIRTSPSSIPSRPSDRRWRLETMAIHLLRGGLLVLRYFR
jgi:tRNA A-37 threonylcarbamoyl transferase component Bud32